MRASEVEAYIQQLGLTAPRVRPADLDNEIEEAAYHMFPGTTVTVCCLMLKNGFTVIGHSACASPANFNQTLGREIAYERAKEHLWQLLGFRLRDRLARDAAAVATDPDTTS